MRKTVATLILTSTLVLAGTPSMAADADPATNETGVISELLPYPKWATDGGTYGDAESCENTYFTYPDGCAIFADFGINTVRYLATYIARLHDDYTAAQAQITTQRATITKQQGTIKRLRAKVRALR